jgi:hypothetical protein
MLGTSGVKFRLIQRRKSPDQGPVSRPHQWRFAGLHDRCLDSGEAHENQMMQLLSNPDKANGFSRLVFDLLKLADG